LNGELEKLEPLDRIRTIFWRLYEFSHQHPQYFELMFMDRSVPRISHVYERFAFAREMKTHLVAQIQTCIDAKVLPAHINASVAFRLLTMGLMGAAMMRLSDRLGRGEDADALARDVLNVTLRGLQSGIALESNLVEVDCLPDDTSASKKVS
jgi:AcrR family transcriptional regulator